MKDRVLELLSIPTDDPHYPTPLTYDQICDTLNTTAAERFQVAQAIIDLLREEKIVRIGDLIGVK